MPAIDCYTHMRNWLVHLQGLLGRPLESDDYIFPAISSTGHLKFGSPMARTAFETLMDGIVEHSGVLNGRNGKFTTHCFRRGGCQYRFMWAPVKWSLKAVKWWGGWSTNDNVGTIMKYLLDELIAYEESYGDIMMHSRPANRHEVLDDRTAAHAPVTNARFDEFVAKMSHVETFLRIQSVSVSPVRPFNGQCRFPRAQSLTLTLRLQWRGRLQFYSSSIASNSNFGSAASSNVLFSCPYPSYFPPNHSSRPSTGTTTTIHSSYPTTGTSTATCHPSYAQAPGQDPTMWVA